MTSNIDDNDKKVQHAEVTVRVAVPVGNNSNDDWRNATILDHVRNALRDYDKIDYLSTKGSNLTKVTSMEERAERQMAEAEMQAEKEAQDRLERHWDNQGHY